MAECCEGNRRLIYACSGCADVGEIADRAARKLSQKGYGNMSCLAGIGARLSGFIESAKSAENITLDGCPVACARKNLEAIGLTPRSFVLTEMGLTKGKTRVTPQVINKIVKAISAKTAKKSAPDGQSKGKSSCDCGGKC